MKTKLSHREVGRIIGKSESYVNKALAGKIKTDELDRILMTLTFFEETLPEIFIDERFVEVCDVAILKGKTIRVRQFASRLKDYATILRTKMNGTLPSAEKLPK
jgi:hypothetical protein